MENKKLISPLVERNRKGQKVTQKKQVKIVLQTRLAKKLYRGGWNGAVGLPKFAGLVKRIWEASSQNDPYADLFLLRIYDRVDSTRKELQKLETKYRKLLKSKEGLEVEAFDDEQPLRIPLYFSTPYAFMCSYVLADFDRLIRVLVTVLHLGLAPDKDTLAQISRANELVRNLQGMPLQWHKTGVTRKDIAENTPLAEKAKSLMGEINSQILDGSVTPPNAPKKLSIQSSVSTTQIKGGKAIGTLEIGTEQVATLAKG